MSSISLRCQNPLGKVGRAVLQRGEASNLNTGRDEEPSSSSLHQHRSAVSWVVLAEHTVAVIARGTGEIFTLQDQGGGLGLCWGLNYKHLNIFVVMGGEL